MTALLCVRDLSFSWANGVRVLNDLCLDICAGERLAVIGCNGAGKSTLLRVILGLERPQAGVISAFGTCYEHERDFRDLRLRVGLVFQNADDQLFCPTVFEDVAFGPLNQGKRGRDLAAIVEQTLDLLGLLSLKNAITHNLSGGQKRLVALASVLSLKPDILLLDEPTNDLDRDSRQRLVERLLSLPQAMVIVSHDYDFLEQVATRACRLENAVLRPCDDLSLGGSNV